MKVDEFAKKIEEESKKEPKDDRRFIFIDTLPNTSINKRTISIDPSTTTKLEIVQLSCKDPSYKLKLLSQ